MYKKSQFGYISYGIGMEIAGIHRYFMAIWNFLHTAIWYICITGILYIFPVFGILYQEKSGNPTTAFSTKSNNIQAQPTRRHKTKSFSFGLHTQRLMTRDC
jgi:type II secretory pathway component PulF